MSMPINVESILVLSSISYTSPNTNLKVLLSKTKDGLFILPRFSISKYSGNFSSEDAAYAMIDLTTHLTKPSSSLRDWLDIKQVKVFDNPNRIDDGDRLISIAYYVNIPE